MLLNETIIQVEESLNDIENVMPKLRMMGLFDSNDGCEVLKQLTVLRELVDKIRAIGLKYIYLECLI